MIPDFIIELDGCGEFEVEEPGVVDTNEVYFRLFLPMKNYRIEISESDLSVEHQNQIHDEIFRRLLVGD